MSALATNLLGARLEIQNATGAKVIVTGVCRGVAMHPVGALILLIVDDAGLLHTTEPDGGYRVLVLPPDPPDDPMTRACTQCGVAAGAPCRVMAAGHYHDARKATLAP